MGARITALHTTRTYSSCYAVPLCCSMPLYELCHARDVDGILLDVGHSWPPFMASFGESSSRRLTWLRVITVPMEACDGAMCMQWCDGPTVCVCSEVTGATYTCMLWFMTADTGGTFGPIGFQFYNLTELLTEEVNTGTCTW